MFEMDTLYLNENCSLLKQIKKKMPFIQEIKNVFYLYERHILVNFNALSRSLDNKHLIVIM